MKILYCTIMIIFINAFFRSLFAGDLVRIENFGNNPGNLKMFLHSAKDSDTNKQSPLVVVLHGCTQRARRISLETGWNKLADTFGFNVIYAQQKPSNNIGRCFNWFSKDDNVKDKGEVASIKSMIDYMIKNYKTDTNHIFIYGVSAGGAMSAAMMACYPSLFNAGCIVAGGPYIKGAELKEAQEAMKNPRKLTPDQWADFVKIQNPDYNGTYPKLVVIHGVKDNVVNIENACNLICQWTSLHKTDTVSDNDDENFPKYKNVERFIYKNNKGETVIWFYKFHLLAHQLPIFPGKEINKGGHIDLFSIKSEFHTTYQIAIDFGLVK